MTTSADNDVLAAADRKEEGLDDTRLKALWTCSSRRLAVSPRHSRFRDQGPWNLGEASMMTKYKIMSNDQRVK